jgi:hypothetical protein
LGERKVEESHGPPWLIGLHVGLVNLVNLVNRRKYIVKWMIGKNQKKFQKKKFSQILVCRKSVRMSFNACPIIIKSEQKVLANPLIENSTFIKKCISANSHLVRRSSE